MKYASIPVFPPTKDRLTKRMVYGDSFDTAINRLLDQLEKYEKPIAITVEVIKPPSPTQSTT